MDWKQYAECTMNTQRVTLDADPVLLSITNSGDLTWQHVAIQLGEHSHESVEACKRRWPRKAIELARAALDEFEDRLDHEPIYGLEYLGWMNEWVTAPEQHARCDHSHELLERTSGCVSTYCCRKCGFCYRVDSSG